MNWNCFSKLYALFLALFKLQALRIYNLIPIFGFGCSHCVLNEADISLRSEPELKNKDNNEDTQQ